MDALAQIDEWDVDTAVAAVFAAEREVDARGDHSLVVRWASITKLATALATLVAAEEGVVELDAPAGPEGSTIRHLLAHASGLPFDGTKPIAPPGRRRIYSNTGFEALADAVAEAAEMPFGDYLDAAVLRPLALDARLRGSPASGIEGGLDALVRFGRELLAPTLVARETLDEATAVQFPGLGGVLPGIGRLEPNDWGLGFELRDEKEPHWTGARSSPSTFGHFGGTGTFLWIDPVAGIGCACLTDREFGPWALEAWPRLSDAVLAEVAHRG